jgi:hypothetical protein
VPLHSYDTIEAAKRRRNLRVQSESLAFGLMFGLVEKAASQLSTVSNSTHKARSGVAIRILPLLSVFSEWAVEHRRYLRKMEISVAPLSTASSSESAGFTALLADEASRSFEERAKEALRSSMVNLRPLVEASIRVITVPGLKGPLSDKRILYTECQGKPLREHVELRGFLPLAARYEVGDSYFYFFIIIVMSS